MRVITGIMAMFLASQAQAADLDHGRQVAIMCAGCHGIAGFAMHDPYPNLAGQSATYLVKQLKAFKTGTRKDDTMQGIASQLSDKDMEDVATYFNAVTH